MVRHFTRLSHFLVLPEQFKEGHFCKLCSSIQSGQCVIEGKKSRRNKAFPLKLQEKKFLQKVSLEPLFSPNNSFVVEAEKWQTKQL